MRLIGDRINFHPHVHVLVTEGGTAPDGAFHHVRRFHDEVIQEIFTREVFSMLLRKKLIGLPLVRKILHWRHTGFNVHSQVRATSKREAERVGKYIIRPVLSLKQLFFDETAGKVRYLHSRHGSQEESMDYLEFTCLPAGRSPESPHIFLTRDRS
ncbi:MAG: transposase [Candidatus Atribacteria bacterium]|nr:transposase [Candidatus Atribacteria bacterium]